MEKKPRTGIFILISAVLISAAGIAAMILLSGPSEKNMKYHNPISGLLEKKQVEIDCLGDSITWGMYYTGQLKEDIESGEIETSLDDGGQLFEDYGIYISGEFQSDPSYPEVLEKELNDRLKKDGYSATVKTANDGICGDWISEDTYKRMTIDPDIVVLLIGGNNYHFGCPIEGMFEKNIEALRKQGAAVYLANYPLDPKYPYRDDFDAANRHTEKMSEKEEVPLIDLYAYFEELVSTGKYKRSELFSPDRIHLSEEGYRLIGLYISDAIYGDLTKE